MADFLKDITDKLDKSIKNNFKKIGGAISDSTKNTNVIDNVNSLFNNRKIRYFLILLSILFLLFILYLYVGFNRVERSINRPKRIYVSYLSELESLSSNKKYMNNGYKVRDFYVASSFKSYLPCANYIDFSSIDAVKFAIYHGARFLDIDIMNKTFSSCTEPVVCNGIAKGNYHLTSAIPFDKVIETIQIYAFNKYLRNNTDPLFINLNFNTWYNKDTVNKSAKIINKYLKKRMLSNEYSYQGKFTKQNVLDLPIQSVIGKVILMTNSNVLGTDMDEIINLNYNGISGINYRSYNDITNTYDENEIIEFNRLNTTIVYPETLKRITENNNYLHAKSLGCQFLLMNYTNPDPWMIEYIKDFKFCSFALKPLRLRHN